MGSDEVPPETEDSIEKPLKLKIESVDHTTVKDMLGRVHDKIDEFEGDIDEEFERELERQLKAKRNGFFIVPNRFWDAWFQKLFAQMISVKMWVLGLITVLLVTNYITNTQFAALFGIIMALKGVFQTAVVWKKNGNIDLNVMDKT